MSLRVLEPGLCWLIVDHGRPGSRSLGVPVGGAADRSALAVGNALLGNPQGAAALEITLAGPALLALQRVGCVVCGAPFGMSSSRQKLTPNKSFTLEAGEELHLGGTPYGVRAYLCVVGGLQPPPILGSRSSLQPLQRGDELACAASAVPARFVRSEPGVMWARAWAVVPALSAELQASQHELRIVGGPQEDWFLAEDGKPVALPALGEFTVGPSSNRMGLRLIGPSLPVPPRELVSEPVCPGAIQVTPDGQTVVLGVDGQTIGGYPKIAQVIAADLDALGQLRPGTQVLFAAVSLETACQEYRQRQQLLARLSRRLRLALEAFNK